MDSDSRIAVFNVVAPVIPAVLTIVLIRVFWAKFFVDHPEVAYCGFVIVYVCLLVVLTYRARRKIRR